jgi:hypothetical protein
VNRAAREGRTAPIKKLVSGLRQQPRAVRNSVENCGLGALVDLGLRPSG